MDSLFLGKCKIQRKQHLKQQQQTLVAFDSNITI